MVTTRGDHRSTALAALAILLAGSPAALFAQTDPRVGQTQLSTADGGATLGAPQVSEPSNEILEADRPADPAPLPPQLTRSDQARDAAPQLTAEGGGLVPNAQLSRGGTAEQPDPLSQPSEGRTSAVTRVAGTDRCDADAGSARPEACERVIETRAAEFARPDPLRLSPEQRLLVDQRLRERTPVMRVPGARPTDAEAAPDSIEGQTVAVIIRGQTAPDDRRSPTDAVPTELPEASAALIEALLGSMGAQPTGN